MQNDKEIIKIAIKVNNETHLHDLPKTHTLQDFINDVCHEHEKNTKISWGFKFNHTVGLMDDKLANKYVTESNFGEVQNGCILSMVPSIDYMLSYIFREFDPVFIKEKLRYLQEMCDDVACIEKMKQNNQHNEITNFAVQVKGEDVEYCLKSLNKIISHGVIPSIRNEFIEFLVKIIKSGDHVSNTTHSMELLTQLINVNANYLQVFKDQLHIDDLTPYFWRDDNLKLQLNTLALLNNIVDNTTDTDKDKIIEEMKSDKNRNIIFKHVISNGKKDTNIAHQLYVYQSHILSSYYVFLNQDIRCKNDYADILDENESNRRNTMIDFEEKQVRSRTNTISSESSNEIILSREQSIDEMDTTILRNKSQSLQSISSIIILSHLTINCMEYYKKKYQKNYTMSVLEAQYYPGFYTICDQIVRMLCDVLHIGKERDKNCSMVVPILFHPKEKSPFFEELFCRAVWLLAKTRREMKARVDEDHEKVLNVLKEQIYITLKSWPLKYTELTNKLKTVSYKEVFDIWEIERAKQWEESLQLSPSIQQLKTKMLPGIEELIREQRMQVLKKGECFPKLPEKRGKQLYWYIYLTQNNQKFQYGDYDPDTQKYTSKKSEVAVSEIAHVVTGKQSPHVKDHRVKRIELFSRCFSLFLKDEGMIDFLAHDDTTAQYWIDGLHLLLGKPAVSEKYRSEKNVLLNMEVNLHLLDLQNVPLSKEPPVVPPLPPDCMKPALPPKSPSLEQAIRKTIVYRKPLNIY